VEQLTANILFSGIGCQERGILNTNLFDLEVVNTSEINKDSTLSYAAIHNNLTNELIEEYKYPAKEEMIKELESKNIGYNFKNKKSFNWSRCKDIKKYWLACKLSNNLGDICKVDKLKYADLWTISFMCTDISYAGKMKGFNIDSNTRSSLLWESIRLLNQAKIDNQLPKYLMFENVKALVSKKFINDFNDLLDILENIGYNIYWKILNGKDCGIPQSRERVFAVCIKKDIDTKLFTFPKPFDNGLRAEDLLEKEVDEKYYLTEKTLSNIHFAKEVDINDIRVRRLTEKEMLLFMGLTNEDYNKIKKVCVSDNNIAKQAGNGIITNCIELIMEHLYKAQYDNSYICYDENFQ